MWEVLGFVLIPIGCDAPADDLGVVLIILGMNIDTFDESGGRGQAIFFPLGFTTWHGILLLDSTNCILQRNGGNETKFTLRNFHFACA